MFPDQPALFNLTEAIDRHLAGIGEETEGIADVRRALQRFRDAIAGKETRNRPAPPACRHFDAALALTARQSGDAIARIIDEAMPFLTWITYNGYSADTIGAHFPKQHAFASIAGPYDPEYALDFDLGLFLIEPHTLYRDHHHQASELYLPLTGPSRWRFGPDTAWTRRGAGEPVWNPPYRVHATLVDEAPLLMVYSWTRDVQQPAQVVPAKDWPALETGLATASGR